ncbi:hypothetical protein AB0M94_40010 [Streptomyces xanthochromogenes]
MNENSQKVAVIFPGGGPFNNNVFATIVVIVVIVAFVIGAIRMRNKK